MALRCLCLLAMCTFLWGCSASADSQQETAEGKGKKPEPSEPATLDPSQVAKEVETAMEEGDVEKAYQLAKQGLTSSPDDRQLLFLAGGLSLQMAAELGSPEMTDQARQLALESTAHFRRLETTYGDLDATEKRLFAIALYQEATIYAAQDDKEQALATLQNALAKGFISLELIEAEEAWSALRESPELKAAIEETFRELTQKELAGHQPFEFPFSLPDTEGQTRSMDQFQGKVLIVDIWGTWCPPCRQEIPHFVALHKKYREAGLEIVGINYEDLPQEQAVEAIKQFIEDYSMTYPCLIGDEATQSLVPNFGAFPTTLFIDRSGKVRLTTVGYVPYEKLESVVQLLLDEPEPEGPTSG